jgi:protein-S-isoprenylcysteine O-methyltransferase Ste14
MTIGLVFLLIRIEIEEKMLIETFGEEYIEYQRNTKKIIPYIY